MGWEPRVEAERSVGEAPAVVQVRGDMGQNVQDWGPTEMEERKRAQPW